MGLEYEEVDVTPELAEEWFANMATNRPLSESNLNSIVEAMRTGNWHDDGTPIRFNEEGRMIDGQHRCMAISITGLTQRFLVVRNVKNEAMTTLDTGKSRSRGNILSIRYPGLPDVNSVAAAGTIILRWKKGSRGGTLRNAYVSNDEFMVFFDANQDDIVQAKKIGRRITAYHNSVTTQPVSLCAYLFAQIDQEDADFFWNRVIDGAGLEKGSPILALRRIFEREGKNGRENLSADMASALIIKAWNAYREGRDIELLAFKSGGARPERYPEPV